MNLKTAFRRARRGLREDLRLYVVAISSLTVAFLCLGGALLGMTNLDRMADRWGESGRMTIYLRDGAREADIGQLQVVLEGLAEVDGVEHLSAAQARAQFVEHSEVGSGLEGLPADVFPASLEVALAPGTSAERVGAIAERLGQFRAVEDVETYRGWFDRLETLMAAGQAAAAGLSLLILICVIAVVGNTIRLAVAGRRQEIEVMKLCGATHGFVRGPFVIEGVFQGAMAALCALVLLMGCYLMLRGPVDETLSTLTGIRATFLSPLTMAIILASGALLGALGSALSLRRYLSV